MIVKNPEAFSSWLIQQLKPICKANPEPVSKYVCALLKKEKSDGGDLKNNLISQLMIFLHTTTEEFVNFLIDALEGDKYMTSDLTFQPSEASDAAKENDEPVEEVTTRETDKVAVEKEKERKSPSPIQAPTPSPPKKVPTQRSSSPRSRRNNRFRNERRRVGGGGARRSRRDNSSHSDSPTAERRPVGTRKRSASGSSESSTKSPRRSWIASRATDVKKYKHRNVARSSPGQRSRSTSPKLRGKRKPQNGNFRKRNRPNSRSNSDDERMHVGGGTKRAPMYHNDNPARDISLEADLGPRESGGYGKKQRCIDFESKGYCARGDMCPFDHGPSPIVLDNNLLNGIVPLPSVVHGAAFADANLYTPQYVTAPHFPPKPFRPDNSAPHPSRELISVPTLPLPHRMKNVNAGKPSYGHIFSSLPPGVSQTTIELTNVPAEQNNIPTLFERFSTFGNITLIQAKRNGDANTALLTYTNATEAALAFINVSSAIPNVKTAWYADKCILKPFPRKSIPASNSQNNSAKAAFMLKRAGLGAPSANSLDPNKTTSAGLKPTTTTTTTKADGSNTSVREPAVQGGLPQGASQLLTELIKKKRDLLEKQLASRKEVQDKIKLLEPGSSEEKTWQEVLKKLNDVIAENESSLNESLQQRKEYLQRMNIVPMDASQILSLRQESNYSRMHLASLPQLTIAEKVVRLSTPAPKNDSVEDSEHVPGDQGLNDTAECNVDSSTLNHEFDEDVKEENEQPCQSSSQTVNESRSPSSGGGEFTRVVVSGFENGDEEELIQHFSQFGKILDKEIDNTIPSATLIYDNRKSAMEAKRDGRNFQDRLLSVTIFSSNKYMPTLKRSTPLKAQEYVPQYRQFGAAANPYKYTKNPQLAESTPSPRAVVPNRNVYSYRAEQKLRSANAKSQQAQAPAPAPAPATTTTNTVASTSADTNMKMTDEEDLVTFLEKGGLDEKFIAKYRD